MSTSGPMLLSSLSWSFLLWKSYWSGLFYDGLFTNDEQIPKLSSKIYFQMQQHLQQSGISVTCFVSSISLSQSFQSQSHRQLESLNSLVDTFIQTQHNIRCQWRWTLNVKFGNFVFGNNYLKSSPNSKSKVSFEICSF